MLFFVALKVLDGVWITWPRFEAALIHRQLHSFPLLPSNLWHGLWAGIRGWWYNPFIPWTGRLPMVGLYPPILPVIPLWWRLLSGTVRAQQVCLTIRIRLTMLVIQILAWDIQSAWLMEPAPGITSSSGARGLAFICLWGSPISWRAWILPMVCHYQFYCGRIQDKCFRT